MFHQIDESVPGVLVNEDDKIAETTEGRNMERTADVRVEFVARRRGSVAGVGVEGKTM